MLPDSFLILKCGFEKIFLRDNYSFFVVCKENRHKRSFRNLWMEIKLSLVSEIVASLIHRHGLNKESERRDLRNNIRAVLKTASCRRDVR